MLVLFHGDNSFDSWNSLLELAAKDQYVIVRGEEITSVNDILKNSDSFSFFSEVSSSAIIIKRLSLMKSLPVFKALEEKIAAGLKTKIYIWEDHTLEKFDKLIRVATQYGSVKLFKAIGEVEMKKFILAELAIDKIKIADGVMNELIMKLPFEKFAIKNELAKVIELVRAQKKTEITSKDLEIININEIESKVWDLTEAIAKKDKRKALALLNKIFKRNEDFPLIIAAIANQFEMLYLMKLNIPNSELISKFKYKSYPLQKSSYFLKNFEIAQLKILFSKLTNLDYNIKQGKIDARLGLNLLISTL